MSVKRFDGNTNVRDSDGTLIVGLMARRSLRQGTVTVTNSPTKIPDFPLSKRFSIMITNISANTVYLGNSSVTTSDGFPLLPNAVIIISIEDSVDIYGIAGSSSELRIFEGS